MTHVTVMREMRGEQNLNTFCRKKIFSTILNMERKIEGQGGGMTCQELTSIVLVLKSILFVYMFCCIEM